MKKKGKNNFDVFETLYDRVYKLSSINYTTPNENRKRNKKKRKTKDAKKRCGLHNFHAPKISLLLLHSFFFRFSFFFRLFLLYLLHPVTQDNRVDISGVGFIVFSPACDDRLSKSNLVLSVFVYISYILCARMCACTYIIRVLVDHQKARVNRKRVHVFVCLYASSRARKHRVCVCQ